MLRQLPLIVSSQTSERLRTIGIHVVNQRIAPARTRLVSANFHFLLDALSQGVGIGLMPDYMVQAAISQGSLEPLALEPGALDFLSTRKLLLHLPDRYQTSAVRTLIAFLLRKKAGEAPRAFAGRRSG